MRALVFTAVGRVELLDIPAPEAGPAETVVTVKASGICGSELHGFRSVGMRVPPLVMGHEFAGVTESGDRVVINPLLACGTCDSCGRGAPQVCRSRELLGVSRPGGFGQQVAVPTGALHALPDDIGWSTATLIEPLANAVHAWSQANGERVGVIGAGAIGLVCALVARHHGAEVTIAETSHSRRAIAESLGLAATTALAGEYDVVFDAVGAEPTRAASIERCRPAGTAVWIGLASDDVHFAGNPLVRQEKRVVGSFAYTPADFAAAVALAPDLDLTWTKEVPLAQAESVFYALANGDTAIAKAVIVPD
ncbi:zinc-binding dehydrogenase [Actinocrispum wychmicini]|uniref:Threonine dehydrogenase-like Zn-dependent dehydrogenase n=1 Tax=Actinocrispum wychmicini TaxID=1213861 RepID=A0A4R2JEZ8_9PSEU|nr:alcohol dehydrogenase catalytic domain-containing protein [Actinocrispum wychmicini]TCO54829.1 threonine dehydrogenase-like Zn-dependent dehydrogenase [Actinocrispum wychmicini]